MSEYVGACHQLNLVATTSLPLNHGREDQHPHSSLPHKVALPSLRQALDVRRSRQQMSKLPASKMSMEVLKRGSGCAGGILGH